MMVHEARSALADALTEKVCEIVRNAPGADSQDVVDLERIVAHQLLTGERSVRVGDTASLASARAAGRPARVSDDELVERSWRAYAREHFRLDDSAPTDLERAGMRAALAEAGALPREGAG